MSYENYIDHTELLVALRRNGAGWRKTNKKASFMLDGPAVQEWSRFRDCEMERRRKQEALGSWYEAALRQLQELWLGNVVFPRLGETGRDGRGNDPHGKRQAAKRQRNDLRELDARETCRATFTGDELEQWKNRNRPLDGPGTGAEGAEPGRGMRSDASGLPEARRSAGRWKNKGED